MCKILAIDPGKTIGFAFAEITDEGIKILTVDQWLTPDWNPYLTTPLSLVNSADVLRIEGFVGNGPRTVESCHVLKMIGAFKLAADQAGVEFRECAPGTRNKYIKGGAEAYAAVMGVKLPIHAKDAWAHLLRECADRGVDYKAVTVTK